MNKRYLSLLFFLVFIMLLSNGVMAQKSLVFQGVVFDESTHQPVTYANISVKNKPNGTTTDEEGRFRISIEKEAVIVFSHINYYKKEVLFNDEIISGSREFSMKPKSLQLSDVVVSASLYEQPIEKLTRSAALISNRQILDNISSNMTDMLANTPGFTQVWEYHSPIILRGLNSNRVLIMKDGNRRIGTFPGGYFGQDMNIYDTKKVEIIKGPGSVIYGSGAISGIINVISNEPFGEKKNSVQLHSGYGTNNNEFLEMVKVCHKRDKFGISVNGKFRKTNEMVYGNGEIAENSDVEDRDITLNTGYKFSDEHRIILNASYHYGDWGKPRGFNGPTKYFTQIRNREENLHTDLAYSWTPGGFVESVNVNLYYDDGYRDYFQYRYSIISGDLSTLSLVHYNDNYGGLRAFTKLNISENNKLTTGVDGYLFRLDNPSELFDYYNDTHGYADGSENTGQNNMGAFIQDEWQVVDKLQVVSGIRFDLFSVIEGEGEASQDRSADRQAFSGNLGAVYSFAENMHMSLNAGRAYRMPTAEELYVKTISCKGTKMGNPELTPEYGWNFDFGFRGHTANSRFKYDLALFYNILDGFINEAPSDDPDIDFTLENTDAKLMGGEFSASYRFNDVFKAYNSLYIGTGAAYVYGIDLSNGDDLPLFGMPPFNVKLDVNYRGKAGSKWLTGYAIKFNTEYAAAQNRVAEIPEGTEGGPWGYVPSDPHTLFNASVELNSNSLPGYPKLRIICKNILNDDYQPFGSYIPAMGRNFKIMLSFHF